MFIKIFSLISIMTWAHLSLAIDDDDSPAEDDVSSVPGEFVEQHAKKPLPWWYEAKPNVPPPTVYVAPKR